MLTITHVTGPLVKAKITNQDAKPRILEVVNVGPNQLLGEIIGIDRDTCQIQVYEETTGLCVGDIVTLKNELLSVELGPGMIGTIFDGIQRPLEAIDAVSPLYIQPGIQIPSLDRTKKWHFVPSIEQGEAVDQGTCIGFVQESELIKHWILVPVGISGRVVSIAEGDFTVEDTVATLVTESGEVKPLTMMQKWAVKQARPSYEKKVPHKMFNTGQRVIDVFFPILLGAPVSTPGAFGAGKTFTQQQLAKWSDAEIVVYVGCGERGNELAEMVKLFPRLEDPRTKRPLMERTILIANTSNMPIAAREASIYSGITIAEYFRDMGYNVVLMADSTSRWAEAMREISARLGEMPSEEGYPAYLSSRIAQFYERSGVYKTYSGKEGSVTVIGTVSPAGGDFSEIITQSSLKATQAFLALDADLAAKRHYPAINWKTSYSLYEERYAHLLQQTEGGDEFLAMRKEAQRVLSKEETLLDMVKLVGLDGISDQDRLIIEIAKSIREDFLQQNGFDPVDTYCSFDKAKAMMNVIIKLYIQVEAILESLESDVEVVKDIFDVELKTLLANLKYKTSSEEVLKSGEEIHNKVLKFTSPVEV